MHNSSSVDINLVQDEVPQTAEQLQAVNFEGFQIVKKRENQEEEKLRRKRINRKFTA